MTTKLYNDVGIVVPTLGRRSEFLLEALSSLRAAGVGYIVLVRPKETSISRPCLDMCNQVVDDPGGGLASAINLGFDHFPSSVQFVNWLGDDDVVYRSSVFKTRQVLLNEVDCVLAYGGCDYRGSTGKVLWHNRSGWYAKYLMYFGPQLVPQPGALIRKKAFDAVHGLDEKLQWAFDLDLFMRLRRLGNFRYVKSQVAAFRWHDDSLSVTGREGSVSEASAVRRRNLPRGLSRVSAIWEIPISRIILFVGVHLSRRDKKQSQNC